MKNPRNDSESLKYALRKLKALEAENAQWKTDWEKMTLDLGTQLGNAKARIEALERVKELASMLPNLFSGASETENANFKEHYGITLEELDDQLNEALAAVGKLVL